MNKTIGIKFSRHVFTEKQQDEMKGSCEGFDGDIPEFFDMSEDAKKNITDSDEAISVVEKMIQMAKKHSANHVEVFGVIPVPIRFAMVIRDPGKEGINFQVNEAWNITRSVEGQKPTFEFESWMMTGNYDF